MYVITIDLTTDKLSQKKIMVVFFSQQQTLAHFLSHTFHSPYVCRDTIDLYYTELYNSAQFLTAVVEKKQQQRNYKEYCDFNVYVRNPDEYYLQYLNIYIHK